MEDAKTIQEARQDDPPASPRTIRGQDVLRQVQDELGSGSVKPENACSSRVFITPWHGSQSVQPSYFAIRGGVWVQ
jgi:hypothetical protein